MVPRSSIIPVYIALSTYEPLHEAAELKTQKNLIFSADGEATGVVDLSKRQSIEAGASSHRLAR